MNNNDPLSGTSVAQIQLNIQQPTATQHPPVYPKRQHIDDIVSDINKNLDDTDNIELEYEENEESDFRIPSYIWDYVTIIILYVIISNNYVRNMLSIYIRPLSSESYSVWIYGCLFALLFFICKMTILKF